jgi:microcompartment protein CcmK/EutM
MVKYIRKQAIESLKRRKFSVEVQDEDGNWHRVAVAHDLVIAGVIESHFVADGYMTRYVSIDKEV